MIKCKLAAWPIILIAVFNFCAAFGNDQAQEQKPIRIGINLVSLDVAVTDKHRRPVRGLSAKDFTILENGVEQRIESFSAGPDSGTGKEKSKSGKASAKASKAPGAAATGSGHAIQFGGYRFTSIVIDNTSVEAINRGAVEQAITSYVRDRMQPDDLLAIYSIGNSLTLVQPFTSDREKIIAAARNGLHGQSATEAATSREEASKEAERASRSVESHSEAEAADRAARGAADQFDALSDYFQASSLFRGLRAVIDAQRTLGGNKSLILFSQGVTAAQSLGYAVDGVISAANLTGVSIYVIDAGGLSAAGPPKSYDPRGNLGLPGRTRPDVYGGQDPTKVIDGENGIERALNRILASTPANRIGALSRLSNETGGTVITNDNDLTAAVQSIDNESRAHYSITYVPGNSNFDGNFREIKVKVSNAEFSVRTRRGYYAVKLDSALSQDEAVLKLASDLDRTSEPGLPLEMAGPYFPRSESDYLVPVVVKVSGDGFSAEKKDGRYHANIAFVIKVKDSSGSVVSTFGRSYQLDFSEEQNTGLASLTLRQNVRLGPGTFIITAAVRDESDGKTSLSRRGITLPPLSDGPHLSSLILVHQADRVPPDMPSGTVARDVLCFGSNRVTIPADTNFTTRQNLVLFFRAYAAKGSSEKASMIVAAGFLKDGKMVHRSQTVRVTQAQSYPGLGTPLATPFDLSSFEPGEYIVRVELLDEGTRRQETKEARFTLVK